MEHKKIVIGILAAVAVVGCLVLLGAKSGKQQTEPPTPTPAPVVEATPTPTPAPTEQPAETPAPVAYKVDELTAAFLREEQGETDPSAPYTGEEIPEENLEEFYNHLESNRYSLIIANEEKGLGCSNPYLDKYLAWKDAALQAMQQEFDSKPKSQEGLTQEQIDKRCYVDENGILRTAEGNPIISLGPDDEDMNDPNSDSYAMFHVSDEEHAKRKQDLDDFMNGRTEEAQKFKQELEELRKSGVIG